MADFDIKTWFLMSKLIYITPWSPKVKKFFNKIAISSIFGMGKTVVMFKNVFWTCGHPDEFYAQKFNFFSSAFNVDLVGWPNVLD
jgi:hypothetical protein